MPTYNYPGYDDNQAVFPGGSPSMGETITFSIPSNHTISITDNDLYLIGGTDDRDDEDTSQTAVVYNEFGQIETSGQIQPRERVVLSDGTNQHVVHRVYVAASNSYYYIFEDPPPVLNVQYTVTSVTTPNSTPYSNFSTAGVTCFTRGVRILTPDGYRPAATIGPGDLVVTRDHGAQPVLQVAHRLFGWPDLVARQMLAPFRVKAGCFGPGVPSRDLLLSRQHRILLIAEAFRASHGEAEVLAPVHALEDGHSVASEIPALGVEYFHLVLEHHEIVYAEGLASETMLLTSLSRHLAAQAQDADLFPKLDRLGIHHRQPARPILHDRDARALVSKGRVFCTPASRLGLAGKASTGSRVSGRF